VERCPRGRELGREGHPRRPDLEISLGGTAYPALTLAARDDLAVVHRFEDADRCLLLRGDGPVPAGDAREFRVGDVPTDFTGDVISTADHARDVLRAFAHGSLAVVAEDWVLLQELASVSRARIRARSAVARSSSGPNRSRLSELVRSS